MQIFKVGKESFLHEGLQERIGSRVLVADTVERLVRCSCVEDTGHGFDRGKSGEDVDVQCGCVVKVPEPNEI